MPRTPIPVRLERSQLAVPGSSEGMIKTGVASAADSVFLDLEDAVAPNEKEAARPKVIRGLNELDWGQKVRVYRMNALDTRFAYRDLIEVVEAAGDRIDCVMVPKVNRPEDVYVVDTLLTQIEMSKGSTRRIGIEAQIENAEGLENAFRIAANERVESLIFGPGDYAASMHMPVDVIGVPNDDDKLYPGFRWGYVYHRVVAAARANGIRAIDGPYAAHRDLEGFERACRIARAMGFDGKWCIHPAQVPIANKVFAPPAKELAWAQRVVAEYEKALAEGRGAITIDGQMIDAASLRMAEASVRLGKMAGLIP